MPNWCENYARIEMPQGVEAEGFILVLENKEKEYEILREKTHALPKWQEGMGFCNYFFPEPSETYNGTTETGGMPDWYSWRTTEWGTKWEVDCHNGDYYKNADGTITFELHFDSAWAPPLGVYERIHARHNEGWGIYATYIEGGMGFCGEFDYGNHDSWDLGTRQDTDVPAHIQEEFSWHYDYMDEQQQEEDVHLIVKGDMTHEQFIDKWGNDTYDDWVDMMNPGTGDPAKKEVANG